MFFVLKTTHMQENNEMARGFSKMTTLRGYYTPEQFSQKLNTLVAFNTYVPKLLFNLICAQGGGPLGPLL